MNINEIKKQVEGDDFLLIKYWKLTSKRFVLFLIFLISSFYFFRLFFFEEKKILLIPSLIIFFVGIGILITKKTVIAKEDYLRIRYSFFYWSIRQESIRQLCTIGRKTIIGKPTYKIVVVLRNTIRFTLLQFDNPEHAKWIENKIAKKISLNIFDQVDSQEE